MNDTTVLCGSHIPVLVKLIQHIDKPVVELGMGWNSTPLLHWMCKEKKIDIVSLETDPEWIKNFDSFKSKSHFIALVERDWNLFVIDSFIPYNELGLVFIDHRPARKRRSSVKFFADKADFILLHDSELADNPAYKYTSIYGNFKYKYEYKSVGKPYTMILSNKYDIERILS